jgi:type II secretory pathway component GspD/PulD (secretin)
MASNHTRLVPTSLGVALRLAGSITIAGLIWVTTARAQSDSAPATTSSGASHTSAAIPKPDGRVRLNMKTASWSKVLKRIARHGGMEVVMKSPPPGSFTCFDSADHTIPDALRIVNRQLEPLGYRVLAQGNYLLVVNLDGMRAGYNIPAFMRQPRQEISSDDTGSPGRATAAASAGARSSSGTMQVSATTSGADSVTAAAPALMELNADGNATADAPSHAADATLSAAESVHLSGEADPSLKDPKQKTAKELQQEKIEKADNSPEIRIFFVSSKWPEVLQSVCEQSGLTLVAKKCPSGTVKFRDWKKHTTGEVISALNHELEENQSNFRLVRQEDFLLVINKDDLRSEYERPALGRRRPVHSEVEIITDVRPATVAEPPAESSASQAPASQVIIPTAMSGEADDAPRSRTSESVRLESTAGAPELLPAPTASDEPTAPAAGRAADSAPRAQEIVSPSPSATSFPSGPEPAPTAAASNSAFVPQHRRVEALSRRLYSALKARSELLDQGPEKLPSFRVFDATGTRSRVACTIGIDTEHNRLVIDAPAKKRSALVHVFARLDETDALAEDNLRLVSADVPRATLAQNVTSELNKFIVQNGQAPVAPPPEQAPGRATLQVTPGQPNLSELIKGLKGEVTVESVPELGILILRGNPTDVDAVMKVIREVERLSAGAAPQISILNLQYVNSESFANLLSKVYTDLHGLRTSETTAKPQIKLYAIVKPNAVLVIAPPAEMPGVKALAAQLDKPVIPETEFQVFPLRHGYAAQVAKAVNDFYKGRQGLGTVVAAVSDARTNSVIVQARPRDLEEVAKLINRLDGPTASQATVKVFTLTNADAVTVVRLLNTLFLPSGQQQGQGGTTQTAQTSEQSPTILRVTADVRTNSVIAVGSPETLQAIYAVILRLDNSDAHKRQTVVFKLKNNSSDAVQRAISDFVAAERNIATIDPELVSTVELLEREVFITSEPVSNSLLLSATPRYFDELKKMIDKLDAPPTQVVIQAMIVQVALTNDDEFGIELGFQSPVLFDRSTLAPPVTLTTTVSNNGVTSNSNNVNLSTSAAPGFQFTDPNLGIDGLGTNSIVNTGTVGTQELTNFGVGRTSNINPAYGSGLVLAASSESVSFLLRALSYKENFHVLSRPMIRTVDNQEAQVQVGKNVPIIYSFTTVGALGTLAPLVRYDGAGIILDVKPRITPEGMIVMDTKIEKSEYEPGGVALVVDPTTGRTIQSPVKDVTRAEAIISVASGETVVVGGLIISSDRTIERKVPWVGDVPILGQLFRYDTKTTERAELLIFLTPRVIRNDADDEVLKQIETDRLHFMLDEAESMHGPILSQPPADGLMQQVPPLTMPSSQLPSAVPPSPGRASPTAPPASARPPVPQGTAPELPPALPPLSPGRPGVAPPPIPREAYFDDPSVPTTRMPSAPIRDVTPLRTVTTNVQKFRQGPGQRGVADTDATPSQTDSAQNAPSLPSDPN